MIDPDLPYKESTVLVKSRKKLCSLE